MFEASCHCGAVRWAVETAPEAVTDCNCSICRRYGVLWAYYHPSAVSWPSPIGPADTYVWGDRSLVFHRCAGCGCVTHWASVRPGHNNMGLNARLLAPEVLAQARVRRLDKAGGAGYLDP